MKNFFTTVALICALLSAPSCSEARGTSVATVSSFPMAAQVGSECSVILKKDASILGYSLTPPPLGHLEGILVYRGDHWVRVDTDSEAVWIPRENIAALVVHSKSSDEPSAASVPSSGMIEPSGEVSEVHVYGNRD